MTITTDRGKTFEAQWAYAPTSAGSLMASIIDDRPLSAICKDLEGVQRIERASETEGDAVYEGYTVLTGAVRYTDGVQITMVRPQAGA